MLKQLGATDETIDALTRWAEAGEFTPREKAALELAERMTRNARGVDEALMSELRRYFTDAEIVELAAVAGIFNYFNRFNDALDVDVTR